MMDKRRLILVIGITIVVITAGIYVYINDHKHHTVYLNAEPLQIAAKQGNCINISIKSFPTCLNYNLHGTGICKGGNPDIVMAYLGNNITENSYYKEAADHFPTYENMMFPIHISSVNPDYTVHWNLTWKCSNGNFTLAPSGYYALCYIQGTIYCTDYNTVKQGIQNITVSHQLMYVAGISASITYNNTTAEISSYINGTANMFKNYTATLEGMQYCGLSVYKVYSQVSYKVLSNVQFNISEIKKYFSKYDNGGFLLFLTLKDSSETFIVGGFYNEGPI